MDFLHPSVSSQIVDNSTTFVTSQGITQLFCAFTSDVGQDNVIVQISSPSEFIFNYGQPNFKKHGQSAYNIMNWLTAQGGLYALRVMPDNAGYSHAIVNIQTKVGIKSVKSSTGALVNFDDVAVRTTVAYSNISNISKDALVADLEKSNREQSVDGYDNHWLLAVRPRGRGAAYDNLGFTLQLTDALDSTYAFRCYNFSVVRTNANGSVQTLEGPFLVSLDPDAVSAANESLHIKYVVEKYSSYFDVEFNETAYDAIGTIINPNVNPNVLDFLGGQTRLVNGQPESYFDKVLKKNVDVHIAVQSYDLNGNATGATNYVDATSVVQGSIVGVDNTYREGEYNVRLSTIDNMKLALDAVRQGTYSTTVGQVASISVDTSGSSTLNSGLLYSDNQKLNTDYTSFQATITTNSHGSTSATLTAVENSGDVVLEDLDSVITDIQHVLDFSRAIENTVDSVNTLVSVFGIQSEINVYNIDAMAAADENLQLINAQTALGVAKSGSTKDQLNAVQSALIASRSAIAFATSLNTKTQNQADPNIAAANTAYTNTINAYNVANDKNQLATSVASNVNNAVSAAQTMLTAVLLAIRTALLEDKIQTIQDCNTKVAVAISQAVSALASAERTVTSGTAASLAPVIAGNIDAAQVDVNNATQLTYRLAIQDFNTTVPFSAGSDGDFDMANADRGTAIKNALINAYKGLVDNSLANKKETPIDLVMDANYDADVKNAIVSLVTQIRDDFMGILDTGVQANPQQAIDFRVNSLGVSSYMVAIFAQDFIVYDQFTGQDIQVTSPYYLAQLIPSVDQQFGLHYPFVGPRRGVISGFKKLGYNPSEVMKESLYKNQINYVESDPRRTKFNSQLTSQMTVSALSNINNVRALLRMKREVELLMEDYEFEFGDSSTLNAANYALNAYLQQWISNRACTSISGSVYQSAYDQQQKIARVRIDLVFNTIIERINIDFVVGS
jgi:hypothetical protein